MANDNDRLQSARHHSRTLGSLTKPFSEPLMSLTHRANKPLSQEEGMGSTGFLTFEKEIDPDTLALVPPEIAGCAKPEKCCPR
jgi:hypothetical protein